MDFSRVDRDAVIDRRRRIGEQLKELPALVFAGSAPPRNYQDAPYPFRASSHFLYLVGLPLEHGVLSLRDGGATLYLPPVQEGDELWHGPLPTFEEIGERTGTEVLPLDALNVDPSAGTIAGVTAATRGRQAELLGRDTSEPNEADLRLADAIIEARLHHDESAVRELKLAAEATCAAHQRGMAVTRPGMREWEVCAEMEAELQRRGMSTAYGSIVTVHGEVLHNHYHHHTLAEGDLLLADVGAESRGGWAGDVTRTWPVGGRFSSTQRAIYECVLAAERAAIELTGPGVRYRDVHLAAARALTEGLTALGILKGDVDTLVADGVHALFFPHGVGHLLGLDVHDMEDLGDRAGYAKGRTRSDQFGLSYLRCDRDLEPSMAVTIEPGFYQVPAILDDPARTAVAKDRLDRAVLAKFADVRGIRIEDDVLVTEDGHEVLTQAIPKDAADVEAATGTR